MERYAQLPEPPELLALKEVPSLWVGLIKGLGIAVGWFVCSCIASIAIFLAYLIGFGIYEMVIGLPMGSPDPWEERLYTVLWVIILGGTATSALGGPLPHIRAFSVIL